MDENFFPVWFAVAMFVGALNKRALAPTIAFSLSLVALYPADEGAAITCALYIVSVLLAQFAD